jgi:hypothetical protein
MYVEFEKRDISDALWVKSGIGRAYEKMLGEKKILY